jgi:uncharacterized protein YukE
VTDAAQANVNVLESVRSDMHQLFEGAHHGVYDARLAQLDSAIRTAAMAIEHLFDEQERNTELRERLRTSRQDQDRHGHQVPELALTDIQEGR